MSQPPSQPAGEPYPGQFEPNPGYPDPDQGHPDPIQGDPAQPYAGQHYPGQPDQGQPDQGQPHPGQPHPGQHYPAPADGQSGYPPPADGHPGYPPPGGQPGYPPPSYPPPGGAAFPGAYPPPVKKKSKALTIVLVSLAVVLVLCIGGVAAIVIMTKDKVASVIDATKISVVEPATLGGRPKLTDPQFAAAATGLKTELAKAPGTTGTVGALYGDPTEQDIVMIAGASAPLLNPSKQLDDTINGASSSGLTLTELITVAPGPLGGTAKCGNGSTSGVKLAVCAWADNGSVGVIAAYFKTADEFKGEFVDLRGQIEKKTT
jgi:hypothetical protein